MLNIKISTYQQRQHTCTGKGRMLFSSAEGRRRHNCLPTGGDRSVYLGDAAAAARQRAANRPRSSRSRPIPGEISAVGVTLDASKCISHLAAKQPRGGGAGSASGISSTAERLCRFFAIFMYELLTTGEVIYISFSCHYD